MLAGWLLVLVLSLGLLVLRAKLDVRSKARDSWQGGSPRWSAWLGAAAVLGGNFPAIRLAPGLLLTHGAYWGDGASHARIGLDLARDGLSSGWVQSYLGGFPLGPHYPPLGHLLLAGLVRAGLTPSLAVHGCGWLATIAAPVVLYVALVRCGARPLFAAAGGLCLAWVAPYNAFVGGYEAFFQLGLLSQVLALPLCIGLGGVLARPAPSWLGVVLAAVAMAAHPQLAVATLAIGALAAVVAGRRETLACLVKPLAAAGIAGAALYGPGLVTLDIPFGWPPDFGWRQTGFHVSRLRWWIIDGDLLDSGRLAAVTALTGAAVVVLSTRLTRPASRAVVSALVAALFISVGGGLLREAGSIGALLLTFLQPLRVVALVPPLAATAVVVALEEGAPLVSGALRRFRRDSVAKGVVPLLGAMVLVVAGFGLPNRARYAMRIKQAFAALDRAPCGPTTPRGFDRERIANWLDELSGGTLWYDHGESSALLGCGTLAGIDVASAVPLGITTAVGSHVGVLWLAAQQLAPERAGSARRAEALGVSHWLRAAADEVPGGWRVGARNGTLELLHREHGTDLVGVGCIRERWRGNDQELRQNLERQFATPSGADRLLAPDDLIALERGDESFTSLPESAPCDSRSAVVEVEGKQPGEMVALIETTTAVEAVFRVAYFPWWRVFIDDARQPAPTLVAPGYLSVSVPRGTHRVRAVFDPSAYQAGLGCGAAVLVFLAVVRRDGVRRTVDAVARTVRALAQRLG